MLLLPTPRRLILTEGAFTLPRRGVIQLLSTPTDLLPAARALQQALRAETSIDYPVVAGGPDADVAVDLLLSNHVPHTQGYEIEIEPRGVHLTAASPEGAYWGAQTLAQILRQHPTGPLPCCQIEDRPDFRSRGVMLDVSRDKVPTMATLFALIDQLAELKINHLQLYTEHAFAYRAHPAVWAAATPITGDEYLALDAYCRERFIELVPNQNSFGHLERWLKHPEYRDLADAPDGYVSPFGFRSPVGSTLNPLDPRSIELVDELYHELLPHFTSPLFNVGCDETFDLGQGKSKSECDRIGKGRVYLDFLKKIHARLQDHQRIMMFWGDIIVHHPELIDQLPRDTVALEWGYEAGHPWDDHLKRFDAAGLPFFVCPGTSSWCSLAGRTDNALANLREAAEAGIAHDAAGYLITDWGDWGHVQPLPVSFLGLAAGAAYSWSLEANRPLDLPKALDAHVFRDRAGVVGRVARDLGNVYQAYAKPLNNGSRLFWTLLATPDRKPLWEGVTADEYRAAERAVAAAVAPLANARMTRPDAALVVDEFQHAADLLTHACRRGRHLLDRRAHDDATALQSDLTRLTATHRRLWLARNREGGLSDSAARLTAASAAYDPPAATR
jgi:hypothetical protein